MTTSFPIAHPAPANDPVPTVEEIEAVFEAAEREITTDRALGVQRWLRTWGKNAAAAVGGNFGRLSQVELDFLDYMEALAEAGRPEKIAARLRREAADLLHRADQHLATDAEFAGKAAFRRQQGSLELAAEFEARSRAARNAYEALDEQAFRKNLRAAQLEAVSDFAVAVADIAGRPFGEARV